MSWWWIPAGLGGLIAWMAVGVVVVGLISRFDKYDNGAEDWDNGELAVVGFLSFIWPVVLAVLMVIGIVKGVGWLFRWVAYAPLTPAARRQARIERLEAKIKALEEETP